MIKPSSKPTSSRMLKQLSALKSKYNTIAAGRLFNLPINISQCVFIAVTSQTPKCHHYKGTAYALVTFETFRYHGHGLK